METTKTNRRTNRALYVPGNWKIEQTGPIHYRGINRVTGDEQTGSVVYGIAVSVRSNTGNTHLVDHPGCDCADTANGALRECRCCKHLAFAEAVLAFRDLEREIGEIRRWNTIQAEPAPRRGPNETREQYYSRTSREDRIANAKAEVAELARLMG